MLADQTAIEILVRMCAAYASLRSYSDAGVVLAYWKDRSEPQETAFETAFARPNLLRFTWVVRHPDSSLDHIEWPGAIWSDGANAYAWPIYNDASSTPQMTGSLDMAVATATGVSGGSALTICNLLMPQIQATSIRELEKPRLLGMEDVDDTPCYHIVGVVAGFGEHDVWIATTDLLLRKLRMTLLQTTHEEIHRNVRYDVELPARTFTFEK